MQIPAVLERLAPSEVKTKKVDARLADVHHPSLAFVEFQAFGLEPSRSPFQYLLGLAGPTRDDKIIGVAYHAGLTHALVLYPVVQRAEIDIGQQRRDNPTLRRAAAVGHHSPGAVFVFLNDWRTQPTLDEPEDAPVADSLGYHFHQLPMGNRIEVFGEVCIDDSRVPRIDALHDGIN